MTMLSPAEQKCSLPSMVKRPLPSSTSTIASPPEACVLISSPLEKANSVMLTASFWASVLLTICPGLGLDLLCKREHLLLRDVFQNSHNDPPSGRAFA